MKLLLIVLLVHGMTETSFCAESDADSTGAMAVGTGPMQRFSLSDTASISDKTNRDIEKRRREIEAENAAVAVAGSNASFSDAESDADSTGAMAVGTGPMQRFSLSDNAEITKATAKTVAETNRAIEERRREIEAENAAVAVAGFNASFSDAESDADSTGAMAVGTGPMQRFSLSDTASISDKTNRDIEERRREIEAENAAAGSNASFSDADSVGVLADLSKERREEIDALTTALAAKIAATDSAAAFQTFRQRDQKVLLQQSGNS